MIDRRRVLGGMAAGLALSSARAGAAYDPPPAPRLPGAYVPPPGTHPFVFATQAKLQAFMDRRGGTFDRARTVLEQRARAALKDSSRYTTPFSGCTLDRYLRALTYEYGGAARVAADLATYAYLANLGRGYGDPDLAAKARDTAKQILMRWATEGFRDGTMLRTKMNQYCDQQGRSTQAVNFEIGLQIGRGIPHWIHAQDVLSGLSVFNSHEKSSLNEFLGTIFELVKISANDRARKAKPDCNIFINYVSVSLAALLTISRYRDDAKNFTDLVFDGKNFKIPWTVQLTNNIYGPDSRPRSCYIGASKTNYFETTEVETGEIVDRFRAGEYQSIGYPMYSLSRLLICADVIQQSGFKAYGQISGKENPMRSALRYYGGYFAMLLSPNLTRISTQIEYPNSTQYVGKIICTPNGKTIEGADDMLVPYLLGYLDFPDENVLQSVVKKAGSFAPMYYAFGSVSSIHYSKMLGL